MSLIFTIVFSVPQLSPASNAFDGDRIGVKKSEGVRKRSRALQRKMRPTSLIASIPS